MRVESQPSFEIAPFQPKPRPLRTFLVAFAGSQLSTLSSQLFAVRTKVTLVLILLNVALFFVIFRFERAWRTEDQLREARRRVLGSETADIRTLTVTSNTPGVPSYTLVRNRDVWALREPLDWPANLHAVRPILQALQFLENETSFSVEDLAKNGQSLADYGLDRPKLTVTFSSGEGAAAGANPSLPATVLQLGDSTKVGERLYVLSPDGSRIHVVNRSLLDVLSVPLEQLRADSLLTIEVFEARALSVQNSGARVRIARREGTKWMFDTIVNARASKAKLDLTIKDLNMLRAASFPTTPPAPLPSVAPTLRVTLDGNNRSETLLLGEPVKRDGAAGAAPTAGGRAVEYFAQLMNGNTLRTPVFTVAVSEELLSRLRNAQTELRERRVLDFDPATISSITLEAPNQRTLTLQRLETSGAESEWQLAPTTDGTSGAQTSAADPAAVHRLLERLALLSATRFESDAPSSAQTESWGFNRPEREITLTPAVAPGETPRPIILQLGTDAAGAVYARTGSTAEPGGSVYAVNINLDEDLPVDARAWRGRTVIEFPANARVAGIKLADLAAPSTLVETTFNADGTPAAEVKDAAAVQALVRALRPVRAQRYVLDHYADRFVLAGDERTWRYELTITLALPAANGEQTSTTSLLFTERVGGAQQWAGSREKDVVFEPEQPLIDALWALTYGPRDPGAPAPAPTK